MLSGECMLCFTTFERLADGEACISLEMQTGVSLVLPDSDMQEYSVSIFATCVLIKLCS